MSKTWYVKKSLGLFLGIWLCTCLTANANSSTPKLDNSTQATNHAKTKQEPKKRNSNPQVLLQTDLGDIQIELFPQSAPKTVANFLSYVDDGFYDGTIFHRVIPGFMIQTGGFTFDFKRKPTKDPVVNESNNGLQNKVGTVAMARTNNPDSATSQFFINAVNNAYLDYNTRQKKAGYTVFGKVTKGMDVVRKIEQQPRGRYRLFRDAPNETIRIIKASRPAATVKLHK